MEKYGHQGPLKTIDIRSAGDRNFVNSLRGGLGLLQHPRWSAL